MLGPACDDEIVVDQRREFEVRPGRPQEVDAELGLATGDALKPLLGRQIDDPEPDVRVNAP